MDSAVGPEDLGGRKIGRGRDFSCIIRFERNDNGWGIDLLAGARRSPEKPIRHRLYEHGYRRPIGIAQAREPEKLRSHRGVVGLNRDCSASLAFGAAGLSGVVALLACLEFPTTLLLQSRLRKSNDAHNDNNLLGFRMSGQIGA